MTTVGRWAYVAQSYKALKTWVIEPVLDKYGETPTCVRGLYTMIMNEFIVYGDRIARTSFAAPVRLI